MTIHFTCRDCIVFCFLLLPFLGLAQTPIIDSAKKEIALQKDGRQKLETIFLLCEQYRSLPPDTLYTYFKMAEALAESSKNPYDKIQASLYKAVYLISKVQLYSAARVVDQGLAALANSDSLFLKNSFTLVKSRIMIKNNQLKEAIENSTQLLQASEFRNDTLWQYRSIISIGWGYMELEQDRQALNWFLKGVHIDKLTNEKYAQSSLYGNITSVYVNLLKFDSAEFWSGYAVRLAKQRGDLTALANAYFINAGIYIELHKNTKAAQLMEEGLKIRKQIGDPFYIVSDIYQLGNFYSHVNEPEKGIPVLTEGIAIAHQYNLPAKLPLLYTALAENYRVSGDLAKYSESLNTLISLKDSMYKKNSADALSDIQTKYEVQKKQNIIIGQQLDLSRKNDLIFGTLILLAATVLVFFIIFQTRKKNQQLKMREMLVEQQKKTMNAVMQAEENERKRIAADLHDSVAQKMVVAKLNLETFEGYLPAMNGEQRHVFDNIFSLVDESCTEVRNLSHSMMPQAFFQSGLGDAVQNFIDKIQSKNLRVLFNVDGDLETLDKNISLMIYRVIQECLQNIIKHAEAGRIDISIIAETEAIEVSIEDNGVGFDPALPENAPGMGFKNIQSRIDFLNGQLDINSSPGKGCVVAFYIPLKQ